MLSPSGIYLLDFESLAFIWIGKDVPSDKAVQAFDLACGALNSINCKGSQRLETMSINVVFYGYEPDVFK